MGRLTTLAAAGAVAVAGCRERAQAVQSEAELRQLVRQITPAVERAAGLAFKTHPVVLRRSRAQVRDYLIHKFDEEMPEPELAGYVAAYVVFGLWPESLDFRQTYIDVLTEQVAGFYEPDSSALFLAADIPQMAVRMTLAHELVHALQDQYANLDSVISQQRQSDRRVAAQAVLEGQALLAQIPVMMPEQNLDHVESFSRLAAGPIREQQRLMPQFASAPRWMREGLIFPYLAGADFVQWFRRAHPDRQPYGDAMPLSTEQILHPDRYAAGDRPATLEFPGPGAGVRYEDGLGEFEIRLLFVELLRDTLERLAPGLAAGWRGDRYRLLAAAGGRHALVWYTVWDDPAAAGRFAAGLERAWAARRAGDAAHRWRVERLPVDGMPGVRLVDAPPGWDGWGRLPVVSVRR